MVGGIKCAGGGAIGAGMMPVFLRPGQPTNPTTARIAFAITANLRNQAGLFMEPSPLSGCGE